LFAAESLSVAVDFAAYRQGSAFVHPAVRPCVAVT
jgi:hypothetical protein